MERLLDDLERELERASRLPEDATYTLDEKDNDGVDAASVGCMQKTRFRKLVSARFGSFRAREVVREKKGEEASSAVRPSALTLLVPSGATYTFDLISHVGQKTFLEARTVLEVQTALKERRTPIHVPRSSLYDSKLKFLFYLGEMHRLAAPQIREYLQDRGDVIWSIDGTLEAGTPTFFGIGEAVDGFLLSSRKIAAESEDAVAPLLAETARDFGEPEGVVHDLKEALSNACALGLSGIPHWVCDFHLCRDIGKDLYETPQAALMKEVRSSKLQPRLKDQRSKQTQRLKEELRTPEVRLLLGELLSGKRVEVEWTETLGREVLIALHQWLMDYASDGHRQGYPFDPYLLYFHRRVVRVKAAIDRLLEEPAVRQGAPLRVFNSFQKRLAEYLENPKVVRAVRLYELAFTIFEKVRNALRLSARGKSPLHDSYSLDSQGHLEVAQSLEALLAELRESAENATDPEEKELYEIAICHLDRYWDRLGTLIRGASQTVVRTTSDLEQNWGTGKQTLRKVHGRRSLTRDFHAMPAELMYVVNLMSPVYVEVVLGHMENLPGKLAEAGQHAPPFTHWRAQVTELNTARLPKRQIREEGLLAKLVDIYTTQCIEAAMN